MKRIAAILGLMLVALPFRSDPDSSQSEFVFARLAYPGGRGFRGGSWTTDWPKADRQFIWGVERLTNVRIRKDEFAIRTTDPELFKYPFIYSVEVGYMNLGAADARQLREYLLRGGFWIVDDFWGTYEWNSFLTQLRKVFPDREIEQIPRDHPLFHSFFDVGQILQVPNVGNGISGYQTHERDGYVPYCLGIPDDSGRLMVVINWNTDLGDAWEWMDEPRYPEAFSGFAYRLGVNFIVYSMTH